MYESKYSKYMPHSTTRFANPEEIKEICTPLKKGEEYGGSGAVLYYENGVLYVDNSDAHAYIQGQTGSKKSRTECKPIVKSILHNGESLVINDPKGEIYEDTAALAEELGYYVYVLNMRDVTRSHGWNPLNLAYKLTMQGNEAEAEQSLNDFIEAVVGPSLKKTVDIFWADNAAMALMGYALLLLDTVPEQYFNLANLIQMSHESNGPALKELIDTMDPNTTAANALHALLDLNAEKTSSCIYTTIKQVLKPFIQNKHILGLLSKNEIDFQKLTSGKCAIYVIYPDEKDSLCFLVNLFFTQCYHHLITESYNHPGARLPNRVNFVLDEFSNLPPISNFENRISEARGHNIRYFLFGQSFGQLKNKYGENANTIISNCDWIIYPSKEIDFLERLARMCGRRTDFHGFSQDLVSVAEIQQLKKYQHGAEVLIMKSGQFPFITTVPDYEYIDVFGESKKMSPREVKSTYKPGYLSFNEWFRELGESFNMPYPKGGRKVDRRVVKKKRDKKLIDTNDIQKLLGEAFLSPPFDGLID